MKTTPLVVASILLTSFDSVSAEDPRPFAIRVVDESSGRGVPLIELRTTNEVRYVTDSAGLVAFDEPGLWNENVYFHVRGHGYEFPKDGFGYRGKAIRIEPGGEAVLKVKRLNVAERLYRVTGGGIYRDSLKLGCKPPIAEPALNALVFGSDSVVNTILDGELLWFWGDTNRPGYPLGNFDVPHAVTSLNSVDPDVGVDLKYEVDPATGFAKKSAKMPGDGPTWIFGLTTLRDESAARKDRVFAGYVKVRPPMEVYEHGVCEYNRSTRAFARAKVFPEKARVYPEGQAFHVVVDGVEYVYFALGYPFTRVKADARSYLDIDAYEAYTPLKSGTKLEDAAIERDDAGRAVWAWRRNAPALRPQDQQRLIRTGKLAKKDGLLALRDAETGKEVLGHAGSVAWNERRGRWVMIICEFFGSSMLGETWYAEAKSPLGPWVYARKIVTHDKYSFYNPKQHPYFAKEGGRFVYFEGTYTTSFSGNTDPTPRYDYNQIMYKLDLDDARLNLPEPIEGFGAKLFAKSRPGPGLIPIHGDAGGLSLENGGTKPAFFALSADAKNPPATTTLLFEVEQDGRKTYSTDPKAAGKPLCRVWINPLRIEIPEAERGRTP